MKTVHVEQTLNLPHKNDFLIQLNQHFFPTWITLMLLVVSRSCHHCHPLETGTPTPELN